MCTCLFHLIVFIFFNFVSGDSSAGISTSEIEVLKKTSMEMWNQAKTLLVCHLEPIPTSVWRRLKWKQNIQLSLELYSVPPQDSEEHTC